MPNQSSKRPPADRPILETLRTQYHSALLGEIWGLDAKSGLPSNSDKGSNPSITIGRAMLGGLEFTKSPDRGQRAGARFGQMTSQFVEASFSVLQHLRPGEWSYSTTPGRQGITQFEQYRHLATLQDVLDRKDVSEDFRTAFAADYLILPDIVVSRSPLSDELINSSEGLLVSGTSIAGLTPLRSANNPNTQILHASISCKWTIRSDRAQNTRTEALNLMRNRKGNVPHIVAVTGEPMPTRLASLALGTGDLDCVYHMALPELQNAVRSVDDESQGDMLKSLVQGRRLRDISDLPLDLAI